MKRSHCVQANVLWAYATWGERMDTASLNALEGTVQRQLPLCEPQALSNVLWAFVKLSHRPRTALLRGCEAQAAQIADTFSAQGLVRCCYRFVHDLAASFCRVHRSPASG